MKDKNIQETKNRQSTVVVRVLPPLKTQSPQGFSNFVNNKIVFFAITFLLMHVL